MSSEESQVFDTPSLTEEAKAQGIEIIETGTDQIEFSGSEGDPLLNTGGETQQSEEVEQVEESTDEATTEETPKGEPDGDLQKEVDKHDKAVNSIKEDLKSKGVSFNDAVKEYESNGSLSEETIKALENAGYPAEVVESFIEGRKAIEAKFTQTVYDSVGGEKEYQKVIQWASQNLPKKSIDSFNRAIDNNNIDAITLMLEGMKAKMVAKMGTTNRSIHGGATAPKSSPKGFTSKQEVIKAMSDPRYGRDAEYTQQVERQMWATNF